MSPESPKFGGQVETAQAVASICQVAPAEKAASILVTSRSRLVTARSRLVTSRSRR